MRIDSSGKVGIGTTSPHRVFEINNSQPWINFAYDIGNGFVDGSDSLCNPARLTNGTNAYDTRYRWTFKMVAR